MEEEIKISVLDDFIRIMKGGISGGMWLALFTCSLLAIMLSIYVQYKKTGKLNSTTPKSFSLLYAVIDNVFRIASGMVLMFFIFRLCFLLINKEFFKNEDFFILFAVGVGFFISMGVDRGIMWLQKKTNLLPTKPTVTVTEKQK